MLNMLLKFVKLTSDCYFAMFYDPKQPTILNNYNDGILYCLCTFVFYYRTMLIIQVKLSLCFETIKNRLPSPSISIKVKVDVVELMSRP